MRSLLVVQNVPCHSRHQVTGRSIWEFTLERNPLPVLNASCYSGHQVTRYSIWEFTHERNPQLSRIYWFHYFFLKTLLKYWQRVNFAVYKSTRSSFFCDVKLNEGIEGQLVKQTTLSFCHTMTPCWILSVTLLGTPPLVPLIQLVSLIPLVSLIVNS